MRSLIRSSPFARLLLACTFAAPIGCAAVLELDERPQQDVGADPSEGGTTEGGTTEASTSEASTSEAGTSEAGATDTGATPTSPPLDPTTVTGPASCNDLFAESGRSLKTGVYTLVQDGRAVRAYCDMTFSEGGWTGFFAKALGPSDKVASFDAPADGGAIGEDCDDPNVATHCMRHLPRDLPADVDIAAMCGERVVTFKPPRALVEYLQKGQQYGWVLMNRGLSGVEAVSHDRFDVDLFYFYAGESGNEGWILASSPWTPREYKRSYVFASAYYGYVENKVRVASEWDYCGGEPLDVTDGGAPPMVRLLYK